MSACISVYLLVAIQTTDEKRHSYFSEHRETRVRLSKLPRAVSGTSIDKDDLSETSSHLRSSQSSVGSKETQFASSPDLSDDYEAYDTYDTLPAPFDPAPYYPEGFTVEDEERFQSSVDELKENKALKSFLCDSLHIHPNELPQTLESLLNVCHKVRRFNK